MALPETLHPDDALVGLVVGALVCGALVLASIPRRRSAAMWVAGVAAAALVAPVIAIGRDVVRGVEPAATVAALVAAAVAGVGWRLLARQLSARWVVVVVGVTAGGVWAAVPDTEAAVTVLVALTPFVLLALVADMPRLSVVPVALWGALALAPAWAAAWGSSARESALPGALACFGVALVLPVVSALGRPTIDLRWLLPLHLAVVVLASRWAARADTIGAGVVRSLALLVVVGLGTAISSRRAAPARPPPSDPVPRRR